MQEQIGKNNVIVEVLFLIKNEHSYFFTFFSKIVYNISCKSYTIKPTKTNYIFKLFVYN
jgi:hypothetical protein